MKRRENWLPALPVAQHEEDRDNPGSAGGRQTLEMPMLSIPYETLLDRARMIATEAHQGQSSKTGGPFIDHVRRVAGGVSGADETLVAWLHDVIEKGPGWTLDRLREEGFSEHVVSAVDAMSKRAGEDYFDFVRRSIRDPLAVSVKRADLLDNLAQMHQIGGDGSKFLEALRILDAGEPGTS